MRYAADLHMHSHHAKAVSKSMTLETMALYARRKGIDVMATGDCLQPEWLAHLEENLIPDEPGWFAPTPEVEMAIADRLPLRLRTPLRFVLSTEVSCVPPGTGEMRGIHHLLYFPSFASARAFQQKLSLHGDLSEGRPTLRLTSRELLQLVLEHGNDCHFAPAHVMNPYFSSLGSQARHETLEEIFGDLTPRLLAVEMGLTSIPTMCRRISSLDAHSLFACSDAHSPENIGRECTLLETEPGYAPLFAALRRGASREVLGCLKFSIHRTRYFQNWCSRCKTSYADAACPKGHGHLATGSRDWLEQIADRSQAIALPNAPRFRMYVPLRQLLAEFLQVGPKSKRVGDLHDQLLQRIGHERFILTKAPFEELARGSSEPLAHAITAQRTADPGQPITIRPAHAAQSELAL